MKGLYETRYIIIGSEREARSIVYILGYEPKKKIISTKQSRRITKTEWK